MRPQETAVEGTWEEIQKQAAKFAGRKVRVVILPQKPQSARRKTRRRTVDAATQRFLDEFSGSWTGDDLDECLALAYSTRTRSEW